MTALLTSADRERYQRDGVIVPPQGLDADTLADLQQSLARWLADSGQTDTDFVPDILEAQPDWLRFASHPAILGPVKQLLGNDVILWGSALFCKAATNGRATPWHQDGQYWPLRPLATVTAWIAIDRVDTGNGCLRVIPGSHRPARLRTHERDDRDDYILNQALPPSEWAGTEPLDLVLEPGQFSLHDVYLIHGATANTSGRRRAGLVFRYMPGTVHYDRALAREQGERLGIPGWQSLVTRRLHLLSGTDRTGRNDMAGGRL